MDGQWKIRSRNGWWKGYPHLWKPPDESFWWYPVDGFSFSMQDEKRSALLRDSQKLTESWSLLIVHLLSVRLHEDRFQWPGWPQLMSWHLGVTSACANVRTALDQLQSCWVRHSVVFFLPFSGFRSGGFRIENPIEMDNLGYPHVWSPRMVWQFIPRMDHWSRLRTGNIRCLCRDSGKWRMCSQRPEHLRCRTFPDRDLECCRAWRLDAMMAISCIRSPLSNDFRCPMKRRGALCGKTSCSFGGRSECLQLKSCLWDLQSPSVQFNHACLHQKNKPIALWSWKVTCWNISHSLRRFSPFFIMNIFGLGISMGFPMSFPPFPHGSGGSAFCRPTKAQSNNAQHIVRLQKMPRAARRVMGPEDHGKKTLRIYIYIHTHINSYYKICMNSYYNHIVLSDIIIDSCVFFWIEDSWQVWILQKAFANVWSWFHDEFHGFESWRMMGRFLNANGLLMFVSHLSLYGMLFGGFLKSGYPISSSISRSDFPLTIHLGVPPFMETVQPSRRTTPPCEK